MKYSIVFSFIENDVAMIHRALNTTMTSPQEGVLGVTKGGSHLAFCDWNHLIIVKT